MADYSFKLLVVGDSGVGKTLISDKFTREFEKVKFTQSKQISQNKNNGY